MLRFKAFWTICITLLLVLGQAVHAQGQNLTLDQATAIALERNLKVTQAQYTIESAQGSVLAAYGNYLPTLSASGSWNRYQNDRPGTTPYYIGGVLIPGTSGFSVNNDFRTGLSLNYTVFDGFAREGTLNRATSNAVNAEQQASRTRQAIVFQVQSAYLNVLRNEQLVKVSEENLRRERRQLERITESSRVGALSIADVYRQQTTVAADELDLITMENNYNKAKTDLLALIGLDVSDQYAISDPTISIEIPQQEMDSTSRRYSDFRALSERALKARPDYLSARESYNATDAGVTIARSGYFPRLSASAGYGLSNTQFSRLSENKNLNWGLNLSWNLFDGFGTNEALQSAIAQRKSSEVALLQTERDINAELKNGLLDLEAARKQYEVSQKGLVSATEDRRIAEERYNLGAGTLLDLLTANAGLVGAQAGKVNAVYNYIVAKRNIEYVLGERAY